MKLSPAVRSFVTALRDGHVSDWYARSQGEANTRRAALDRGLVRYYPHGDGGCGSWGITNEGRKVLRDLEKKEDA